MDRGEALRLILMLYVIAFVYHRVNEAEANHAADFPIVKEAGLCDGNDSKPCRYLLTEECVGIQAVPPRLARTEAVPCPGEPSGCTPNGWPGAYMPGDETVILPKGNTRWLEHEFVHHLLFKAGRADWRDHSAPEFACE